MKRKNKKKATENKLIKRKEKFGTRFINTIKKKWLISGTNTILLIAILIAITIFINSMVKSFKWTPIDLTSNKQYTLTETSKDRIKNITNNVDIYLVGYTDTDSIMVLANQYNKANKNINIEIIDLNTRTDIATEFSLKAGDRAIIVKSGEKSKVLTDNDLSTYDKEYNQIDITEEKITSSILNITSEKIAKVYFLNGYSDYSLDYSGGMSFFAEYLKNEVLEYETLDFLTKGTIPEDCDTLVITTPSKDFDELTANEIIKYINNGGNILWLNSSYAQSLKLPNVNKVLALYGVNPFEIGYIYEEDDSRKVLGYSSCIIEDVGYSDITKNLKDVLLLNATKINIDTEKLEELNVTEEKIISASSTAYFRKDISNQSQSTDGDEQATFTIGTKLTKTIKEEKSENEGKTENTDDSSKEKLTSTLIIFGDNNFISDIQINNGVYPTVFLEDNKDVALNSIAYLTDNQEDITIRKNYTKQSSFTATDSQKNTIMRIVFLVPVAIIAIGLVVWQIRRRKK